MIENCTQYTNLFTKPYLCMTFGDALLIAFMAFALLGIYLSGKYLLKTWGIGTDTCCDLCKKHCYIWGVDGSSCECHE